MSCMFSYCSSLTSLNLSNFNTHNVNNMSNMFHKLNSNCKIETNDMFFYNHLKIKKKLS